MSKSASSALIEVGDLCLLPGLVDTHVHINAPGRTEWEGFATASRAAAAGGYTCLVDMPLNCVPATTRVAALEEKRQAARGMCLVDYAFWGGAVKGNADQLLPLAQAGVRGFKSFLVHPGIEEFSMADEQDLRLAMPLIAQTGLPLLVHAEDPAEIARAGQALRGDPREYKTYLASRPDEAETRAIELMIELCREYRCRVHIVHLSTCRRSAIVAPRTRGRTADNGGDVSALFVFRRGRNSRWRYRVEMRTAYPGPRQSRTPLGRFERRHNRPDCNGPLAVSAGVETRGKWRLSARLGRYRLAFRCAFGNLDRSPKPRVYLTRFGALDEREDVRSGRPGRKKRAHCTRLRCRLRGVRSARVVCCAVLGFAFSPCCQSLLGGAAERESQDDNPARRPGIPRWQFR